MSGEQKACDISYTKLLVMAIDNFLYEYQHHRRSKELARYYWVIIQLRRAHIAHQFVSDGDKRELKPPKGVYNLSKFAKRTLHNQLDYNAFHSDQSVYNQNLSLKQVYAYRFEQISRFHHHEAGHRLKNEHTGQDDAGRHTLWVFSTFLKVFGSAIRCAGYFQNRNKNINNTLDFSINFITMLVATLAMISLAVTLPFSGVAMAAIAALSSLLRGVIGVVRGGYRIITTNNVASVKSYAKEFISGILKVALFFAFAGLVAAGPAGLAVATALLVILALPDIRDCIKSIPGLRKVPEKVGAFFVHWMPVTTHFFDKYVTKALLLFDYLFKGAVKSIVRIKLNGFLSRFNVKFGVKELQSTSEDLKSVPAIARNPKLFLKKNAKSTIIDKKSTLDSKRESDQKPNQAGYAIDPKTMHDGTFRQGLTKRYQKLLNTVIRFGSSYRLKYLIVKRMNAFTRAQRKILLNDEKELSHEIDNDEFLDKCGRVISVSEKLRMLDSINMVANSRDYRTLLARTNPSTDDIQSFRVSSVIPLQLRERLKGINNVKLLQEIGRLQHHYRHIARLAKTKQFKKMYGLTELYFRGHKPKQSDIPTMSSLRRSTSLVSKTLVDRKKPEDLDTLKQRSKQIQIRLYDFHRIRVYSNRYRRKVNDGIDLSGCHHAWFKDTSGYTRNVDEYFDMFSEFSAARSFGNDLLKLVKEKIAALNKTRSIFWKTKHDALKQLEKIIDISLNDNLSDLQSAALEILNDGKVPENKPSLSRDGVYKQVVQAIKKIASDDIFVCYSFFWRKSETDDLFKYAVVFARKFQVYQWDQQDSRTSLSSASMNSNTPGASPVVERPGKFGTILKINESAAAKDEDNSITAHSETKAKGMTVSMHHYRALKPAGTEKLGLLRKGTKSSSRFPSSQQTGTMKQSLSMKNSIA